MNEFAAVIRSLGQRRDTAAQEHMNAIVSAQRLEVQDLVDKTQEMGCSFEEATRALFESIVHKIIGSCLSEAELDHEVYLMRQIMQRLIKGHEDD